jgi:CubicO group peptidase (beta-lactamase class C family)
LLLRRRNTPALIPLSERVDPIVNAARTEQKLPAVSVAIASRGKLDYDRAFGMADMESEVPATTQTLFRTGSIAKPITAVAAIQLVERRKLDLDVPHRAHGYQNVDGKVENAALMDSSYKIPGGGWVTPSEDLIAFSLALLNGKLVKPETLAMIWTPVKLPSGKSTNYGYGFRMIQVGGQSGVAHSGGHQGTSTDLIILPNPRFVSVVMINMNDKNAEQLNRQIAEAALQSGAVAN